MVGGYLVDMTMHFANGGLISRFTRANGPQRLIGDHGPCNPVFSQSATDLAGDDAVRLTLSIAHTQYGHQSVGLGQKSFLVN